MSADVAVAPIPPMLIQQFRVELLRLIRVRAFSIFSLGLPIMFFAFFGANHINDNCGSINCGAYLLASFGSYGFTSMMLFSFGIGVAVERGQRTNVLFRAAPVPGSIILAAKVVAAALFGVISLLLLDLFAYIVGARVPLDTQLQLTGLLTIGSLPFVGMGFAIGYLAGPNSAPALANLIYLPMAFASGMFIPIRELPKVIADLAPYLPTYRYVRLAWGAVGETNVDSAQTNLEYLLGFALVFLVLAVWAYRREEKAKFA